MQKQNLLRFRSGGPRREPHWRSLATGRTRTSTRPDGRSAEVKVGRATAEHAATVGVVRHLRAPRVRSIKRQAAICCIDRVGGNPLKRKTLCKYVGAEEAIDTMAAKSPAEVREMLCTHFAIHTSCREVETFRQKRFRLAGGRTAFMAALEEQQGM